MTCDQCGSRTTTGGALCAACRSAEHQEGRGESFQYGWELEEEDNEEDSE